MRLWIGLVFLLAACAPAVTPSPSPSGHVVTGTFELFGGLDSFDKFSDGGCAGLDGFDDIVAGLDVTATNESGTIIGSTPLEAGVSQGIKCVFAFTFESLPEAEFYTFEAGQRGKLTYSRAEMESLDWSLGFTLGS